jgi:hypothetical protein
MSTTTTATEAAAAAGVVITVTGSFMGLQFEAMMIGFVGALVAQTLVPEPPDDALPRWRRYLATIGQLVAAGLLAGMLTPLAESLIAGMTPGRVPPPALHMAVAGVIGMVAPVIVPVLRKITKTLADKP